MAASAVAGVDAGRQSERQCRCAKAAGADCALTQALHAAQQDKQLDAAKIQIDAYKAETERLKAQADAARLSAHAVAAAAPTPPAAFGMPPVGKAARPDGMHE